jgi:hypothetical protein
MLEFILGASIPGCLSTDLDPPTKLLQALRIFWTCHDVHRPLYLWPRACDCIKDSVTYTWDGGEKISCLLSAYAPDQEGVSPEKHSDMAGSACNFSSSYIWQFDRQSMSDAHRF